VHRHHPLPPQPPLKNNSKRKKKRKKRKANNKRAIVVSCRANETTLQVLSVGDDFWTLSFTLLASPSITHCEKGVDCYPKIQLFWTTQKTTERNNHCSEQRTAIVVCSPLLLCLPEERLRGCSTLHSNNASDRHFSRAPLYPPYPCILAALWRTNNKKSYDSYFSLCDCHPFFLQRAKIDAWPTLSSRRDGEGECARVQRAVAVWKVPSCILPLVPE